MSCLVCLEKRRRPPGSRWSRTPSSPLRTADDCSPEIIDRRMDRFRLYLALLKQNFYKEAYL